MENNKYMDWLDETILVFAFRYAVGRSTGAGLQVLNKIKRVIDEITTQSREEMIRDIDWERRMNPNKIDHHILNELELLLKESLK